MVNKKLTGSFYTPQLVADFLSNYLLKKLNDKNTITVLEPSAGDGAFIKALYKSDIFITKAKK